jgi:hypothetical protein
VDGKTTRLGELGEKITCTGCEYLEEGRQLSAKLHKDIAFKKIKDGLWEVKPKFIDGHTLQAILSVLHAHRLVVYYQKKVLMKVPNVLKHKLLHIILNRKLRVIYEKTTYRSGITSNG